MVAPSLVTYGEEEQYSEMRAGRARDATGQEPPNCLDGEGSGFDEKDTDRGFPAKIIELVLKKLRTCGFMMLKGEVKPSQN